MSKSGFFLLTLKTINMKKIYLSGNYVTVIYDGTN